MHTIVYDLETGHVLSTANLRSLTSGDRLTINRIDYRVMGAQNRLLPLGRGQRNIFVSPIE